VRVEKSVKAETIRQFTGRTRMADYVAKEVKLDDNKREAILKELDLHKSCSSECPGVVPYVLSGVTLGEPPSLIVVMGACQNELWDSLIAYNSDLTKSKSSLSKSGVTTKPGLSRQTSQISTSTVKTSSVSLPSEIERVSWTSCLCETVRHCHVLGVLHRDLNPWNVLIATEKSGSGSRNVRVADFGLAVRLSEPSVELTGLEAEGAVPLDDSALGSLYSAPELGVQYGLPADIFSLGMVLFAIWSTSDVAALPNAGTCEDTLISCIEGVKQAAISGTQVPEDMLLSMREGCDSDLREIILRMVSAKPQDRPSAREVCEQVEKWLTKRGGVTEGSSKKAEISRSSFARFCSCLRKN
jgi:serine/threonine protein kinase